MAHKNHPLRAKKRIEKLFCWCGAEVAREIQEEQLYLYFDDNTEELKFACSEAHSDGPILEPRPPEMDSFGLF